MKKKIILITGGQRSGKSSYAMKLALSNSDKPMYLATSAPWDEEHQKRIKRHQHDRGSNWTTIEELRDIQVVNVEQKVVVIDCLTLWTTNFLNDHEGNIDTILSEITSRFDAFTKQNALFIFVTNEIGLGGVSANALQRKFTDLLGWVNQHVTSKADEVFLMISGIPIKIK
ncbi:MAG: adenosylcobinamide kinase/adenosylcobinamide phosphate guanyltransferase [Porphyromonadaceae bacterium CG2_30_38_12]|nr:MAG: adenosylcobinamide kinase/adenosylcobinamide phosphate guanyltransferase [Porphyromonadaceae bacterium CG2_30_38_12]